MAKNPIVPVSTVDIVNIEIEFDNFLRDARKISNKAAATRARITSLKLGRLLKNFRYNSIKPYSKQ